MASKSTPPPPGVYVPAVAFMTEDEELDRPSIEAHVLRLAEGGVKGILVQGSNGEAQHLSHDERRNTIRWTRDILDNNGFKDVVVIAGTGAQSTRETIQLCGEAKSAGASYALVLTPSTWPPQMSKANIIRFHQTVADQSPIPTMIYNFPTVTAGIDLDSDTIATLAAHPNIVGIKLSCGNVGKLHRLTSSLSSSEFATFPGKSDVFFQSLMSGGAGVIGALPNIAPKLHVKLLRLFDEKKFDEAVKLQALLGKADWELGKLGSIAGIKAIVANRFEYGAPYVRGPLVPLKSDDVQATKIPDLDNLINIEKTV
ncbi:hypothetical protein EW026_g2273 [Hermanssonia centrifuga]|uniref:Uncharacterized protein n=1 Tax=Hermanssonia centrifuga TaxID=98765 RepID=A0A4V3XB10_9APHY|nr:hypothetical protein EW026_g2273 [Hermanssonia centrifuga]